MQIASQCTDADGDAENGGDGEADTHITPANDATFDGVGPNGEEFFGTATGAQINSIRINNLESSANEKLRIGNATTKPIWINYQAQDMLWPQTLKIPQGKAVDYIVPSGQTIAATRFWPKYDCDA